MGWKTRDTNTIHRIPGTLTTATDLSAGWVANRRTPVPINTVNPDKDMAEEKEVSLFLLKRYRCNKPSVMKMLKSSPRPKMKVAKMTLTKLNLISNKTVIPRIQIQLMAIGRNDNKANSRRP